MKMNVLPVETGMEWIRAWAELDWPVSWETAFALRDRLGWVSEPDDGTLFDTFLSGSGQDGGGYMVESEEGVFNGISIPLASKVIKGQKESSTAATTWAAYDTYLQALTGRYGHPRLKAEEGYREATWYLPNGSSLDIGALPGILTASVDSPEVAFLDFEYARMDEKYGPGWEDEGLG